MRNTVLDVIKSRRSIRRYLPDQVKEEELQAILEAGAYAPSAHNDQSWHFTVIRNRELIDHISRTAKERMAVNKSAWVKTMGRNKLFHVFYHAPVVVVVSMRKDAMLPLVDCSAAIENMLIAAESLDIGSCWIGLTSHFFALKKELPRLRLPKGYEPCFAVTLGYKGHRPGKAVPRKENAVNYID